MPEEIKLSEETKPDLGLRLVGSGPKPEPPPEKPLKLAPAKLLRLDLASGQTPKEGFEGVDLNAPNPEHRINLLKFPWPWTDNSAEDLHCSHFVEHIPLRDVEERDLEPERCLAIGVSHSEARKEFVGKDMLFAFFDECYRILAPGCKMTVQVPCLRSNRAFQDPTHRRFIPAETFLYLNKKWMKENKLDHYRVNCDFDFKCDPIVPIDMANYHPEAQATRLMHYWNTVIDWATTLTSLKPK